MAESLCCAPETIITLLIGYESESCSVVSTLCDSMDYTVDGILQARILEWVAFPFSRGSSQPRDWTQVSCIAGGFFTNWAMGESSKLAIHQYKIKSLIIKRKRKVTVREAFKDALLLALKRKEGTMNPGMKSSLRIWKRNQSCHQQCLQFSETYFGLLASRIIRE